MLPVDILEKYGFDIFEVHEEDETRKICEIKDPDTGLYLFKKNTFDPNRIDFRCQAYWKSPATGKESQCKCEAVNLGGKCVKFHHGGASGRPKKPANISNGFYSASMSVKDKRAMEFLRDSMSVEEKNEEMLNLTMTLIKRAEDMAHDAVRGDAKKVIEAVKKLKEKGDISERGADNIINALAAPPHKAISDYLKNAKMFLDCSREFSKQELIKAKCNIYFEFICEILEIHASKDRDKQQSILRIIDVLKNKMDRSILEVLQDKTELAIGDDYITRFQPNPEDLTNRIYVEEGNAKEAKLSMPKNENKPAFIELQLEDGKWIHGKE